MEQERCEDPWGLQVKKLAIKIMSLALGAGFAPAMQQMQRPFYGQASADTASTRLAVSSNLQRADLHPMT